MTSTSSKTWAKNRLKPWSARCRAGAHWACYGNRVQGKRSPYRCECACHLKFGVDNDQRR